MLASIELSNQGALKLTNNLVQSGRPVKVIITGLSNAKSEILRCIEEGAVGYVLREESLADMVKRFGRLHVMSLWSLQALLPL